MNSTSVAGVATQLVEIPITGLRGGVALRFPIYIRPTPERPPVLFADFGSFLDMERLSRFRESGVEAFFVPQEYLPLFFQQMEDSLEVTLQDHSIPLEDRCQSLMAISVNAAEKILKKKPDQAGLARISRIVQSAAKMAVLEPATTQVLRRLVGCGTGLAHHSVNTSLYGLGLGLALYGADQAAVARLTLAAFIHDVGRIPEEVGGEAPPPGTFIPNREEGTQDYTHALEGARHLAELGMDGDLVTATAEHHERMDGSGAPRGLSGEEIHPLSRAVAMVNVFDHVRSHHRGYLNLFETFKIVMESYKDCFDQKYLKAFLITFAANRKSVVR